jgi:hypothetical protein
MHDQFRPTADDSRTPDVDLAGAAHVLADYLFTHPNPPGWRALVDAANQNSDHQFG